MGTEKRLGEKRRGGAGTLLQTMGSSLDDGSLTCMRKFMHCYLWNM